MKNKTTIIICAMALSLCITICIVCSVWFKQANDIVDEKIAHDTADKVVMSTEQTETAETVYGNDLINTSNFSLSTESLIEESTELGDIPEYAYPYVNAEAAKADFEKVLPWDVTVTLKLRQEVDDMIVLIYVADNTDATIVYNIPKIDNGSREFMYEECSNSEDTSYTFVYFTNGVPEESWRIYQSMQDIGLDALYTTDYTSGNTVTLTNCTTGEISTIEIMY